MFYDNLKSICESRGLKITTVVTDCGGALGSISKWKKGACPNSDIVVKLSLHLGVTTDYLLLGEKSTPKATTIELPQPKLTENEEEMLSLLNQLSERDQIRLLGRVEGIVKEYGAKSNTEENVG